MVSILYVDDDAEVVERIRTGLQQIRPKWRLQVASSATEAMTVLSNAPLDVIITEMNMPGTDGAQLLREVRERFPRTIRIMLSGFADTKEVMKSVGEAHQYLTKPLKTDVLALAIEKATALDTLFENERLRSAVTQLKAVPSLPEVYNKLMMEVSENDPSIKRIASIIRSDIGMTAKILQIANSAFFGFQRTVTDPVDAVRFLGIDTISSLTLAIGIFTQFQEREVNKGYINEIWNHSRRVAQAAKDIASIERPTVANDAFTAGLLHDLGEVLMAVNAPREFAQTRDFNEFESQLRLNAEREIFGATHTEIGAYLLNLWGIPSAIVEAVAFHHTPSKCRSSEFSVVTAVHAADALVYVPEFDSDYRLSELCDLDYFHSVGFRENIDIWLEKCIHQEPASALK